MSSRLSHSYWRLLLAPLAVLGIAAGATATQAQEEPLIVNMAVPPATLDPGWLCGIWEAGFVRNFYVRLTQYDTIVGTDGHSTQIDTGNIVPYFARSAHISDDKLVYTFVLPAGHKFPSGHPVDAAAAKYSFERSINMGGCGSYFIYDGFYDPPLIKTIEVVSPTKLVITLNHPDKNALQNWAQTSASLVDKSVVDQHGGVQTGLNEWMSSNVAGSGPFLLDTYQPGDRAVLKANPDFFGERPGADTVIFNFINSDPTLLLEARTGNADITLGMNKVSIASLREDPCCNIVANVSTQSQQIGLPNSKPPWDNPKVRMAVSYAVPYKEILENVALGYGEIYGGPLAPGFPEYDAALTPPRTFDMAKAKSLMAESGLATPIDVEIHIFEGDSIQEQIATIVQGHWSELGINLQIRKQPNAVMAEALEDHTVPTYMRLDGPGVIEAGYFHGYDLLCNVGFNLSEVCIPEADEILHVARQEPDAAKQRDMYRQISTMWYENQPKIHVFAEQFAAVLSKDVTNYHFSHMFEARYWSKR